MYILSQRGATDEASRWLAERENASDLIGGVSLDDKDDVLASVLLDLSQSASLNASQVAAERVLHQLTQAGEVRKPEVQQARFMVLKSPDIPSMLVETAYISNPQEEQRLRTATHQAKLAAAIHQGVHDYFYANPPMGTRIAQLAAGSASRCWQRPPVRAARASNGLKLRIAVVSFGSRTLKPLSLCENARPEVAIAHSITVRFPDQPNRRRRGDRAPGFRGQGAGRKRAGCGRAAHRG